MVTPVANFPLVAAEAADRAGSCCDEHSPEAHGYHSRVHHRMLQSHHRSRRTLPARAGIETVGRGGYNLPGGKPEAGETVVNFVYFSEAIGGSLTPSATHPVVRFFDKDEIDSLFDRQLVKGEGTSPVDVICRWGDVVNHSPEPPSWPPRL